MLQTQRMGASKKARAKEKKAKKQKAQDVIQAANTMGNQAIEAFKSFRFQMQRMEELSATDRIAIVDLFEQNMKQMYLQSTWGYDPEEKYKELFHTDSRYLISRNPADVIVAFVHYRFVLETSQWPALYVYEIQVSPVTQRTGVGRYLMTVLEDVAIKWHLKAIMLTVFTFNNAALEFYKEKLQFQIDASSPRDETYEILTKLIH